MHRNDAEPLVARGQQEAADNDRDTQNEKGDQQTEQHLAQERRPIEREEGADAAESKGDDHADRKGKANGDEMYAARDGFQGKGIEVAATPLRRLAEEPLDTRSQTDKDRQQQQDFGPSVFAEVRADAGRAPLELGRHIGNRIGETNNVLTDRAEMGIKGVRNRLSLAIPRRCRGGLCLVLLLQPRLNLGVGEQCQQLLDLRRRRFFAGGSRAVRGRGRCRESPRQQGRKQDGRCEAAPQDPQNPYSHSRGRPG